jgi:hypothetical protein
LSKLPASFEPTLPNPIKPIFMLLSQLSTQLLLSLTRLANYLISLANC